MKVSYFICCLTHWPIQYSLVNILDLYINFLKKGVFLKLIPYKYSINYFIIFPPILERLFWQKAVRLKEQQSQWQRLMQYLRVVTCAGNLIRFPSIWTLCIFYFQNISNISVFWSLLLRLLKFGLGMGGKGLGRMKTNDE